MNIVLDNKINDFGKIANCLAACNIQFSAWNSEETSELDMVDMLKPEILFYSSEVDEKALLHGIDSSNVLCVHVGDLKAEASLKPSLVIGSSRDERVPFIPVSSYMVDIFGVSVGKYSDKIACGVCCFTETLGGLSKQMIASLVNVLINHNARFFGSLPLDTKNYLGPVGAEMRSHLCASSNFCIDISGQMWGEILYAGGNPVVFTEAKLRVPTFSNLKELEKIISQIEQEAPQGPTALTKNMSIASRNYGNVMAEAFETIGLEGYAQVIRKEKGARL